MSEGRPKGFSLIEAAIVLGIVGLVIGGIWVAAAAVKTRMAISGAMEMAISLRDQAKTLAKTTNSSYNLFLVTGRALPGGFTVNGTTAYGHNMEVTQSFIVDGTTPYLRLDFTLVGGAVGGGGTRSGVCAELSKNFMDATKSRPPSGYHSVAWNDQSGEYGGWDYPDAKLPVDTLSSYCSQTYSMTIVWGLT